MGRKITPRKHFGVRDPIQQLADREAKIKDKINNPPEKRDFQKVSHSLARFMKLKEDAKKPATQKTNLKRKATGKEDKPENYPKNKTKKKQSDARNDKEFENLHQRKDESDRGFMRRVNRVTQDSVEEAKFEAKYGVEVVRNAKTGEIKLKKRPPNEIDDLLKQNASNAKKGKKGKAPITISSEERKKLVKAMMEEKKQKKADAEPKEVKEFKRDEFKFGEVVNEPPTLTVPRLAKKAETVPRPGRKSHLLLHSVIDEYSKNEDGEESSEKEVEAPKTAKATSASLKGKRKELSMSMRKMIESEQANVVKLYKELKKTQRAQNNNKT